LHERSIKNVISTTFLALQQYNKKYSPELRVRFSMLNMKKDDNFINMPLFMADRFADLVLSNEEQH